MLKNEMSPIELVVLNVLAALFFILIGAILWIVMWEPLLPLDTEGGALQPPF